MLNQFSLGFLYFWFRVLWVLATVFVITPLCVVMLGIRSVALIRRQVPISYKRLLWPAAVLLVSVVVALLFARSVDGLGAPP
jgi:hypothetical protein